MRDRLRYVVPLCVLLVVLIVAALIAGSGIARQRVVSPMPLTVPTTATTILR